MKISEYIVALEHIKAEHGDLEVAEGSTLHTALTTWQRGTPPEIRFVKKRCNRERIPCCWSPHDGEERKGQKVCWVGR